MTHSVWAAVNDVLAQRCGWVFLHFLWQGVVVLAALTIALAVFPRLSAVKRYAISWAALLTLTAAPVLTYCTLATGFATAADNRLVPGMLGLCWMLGAAGMGLRLLVLTLGVELTRVAGARPLGEEWPERVDRLARRLGISRPVGVLESTFVDTPATLGWFRPVVLLPRFALHGLDRPELEAVIGHELAHVRRGDFLANLLQSLVEAVLFFHPAVWWVSRTIRAEREYCCDDLAADLSQDRHLYAKALYRVQVARFAAAELAMCAKGGGLKTRIERLLGRVAAGTMGALDRPVLLSTSLLVALGLIAISGAMTDAGAAQQPEVNRRLVVDLHLIEQPPNQDEIFLPTYGRVAVRGRVLHRKCYQEFTVYNESPGTVAVQLVPMTEGFEPFLAMSWPCSSGELPHSDGDMESGRGHRPFQNIILNYGKQDNALRLRVYSQYESENPRISTEEAEYIAVLWQPRVHNDIDPDVLGPEATPVLLDENGFGAPDLGNGANPPPTLDYGQDVDTFQLRATADGLLTITVDGTVGNVNPYLRVYDQHGELLTAAAGSGERVAETTVTCQESKIVYFAVSAYDGRQTGQYTVSVRESRATRPGA